MFTCVIELLFFYHPFQEQGSGEGREIPRKTAILLDVVSKSICKRY